MDELTQRIYLYIIKANKPCGPRDVMHALSFSSSAVAYRGLQKLVDFGLVEKDAYGRYLVKEKFHFKGYIWVGKNLVHRLFLFGGFFTGLLIPELVLLITQWNSLRNLEPYLFAAGLTTISAIIFFFEGIQLQKANS
jgi:hypothetical protein